MLSREYGMASPPPMTPTEITFLTHAFENSPPEILQEYFNRKAIACLSGLYEIAIDASVTSSACLNLVSFRYLRGKEKGGGDKMYDMGKYVDEAWRVLLRDNRFTTLFVFVFSQHPVLFGRSPESFVYFVLRTFEARNLDLRRDQWPFPAENIISYILTVSQRQLDDDPDVMVPMVPVTRFIRMILKHRISPRAFVFHYTRTVNIFLNLAFSVLSDDFDALENICRWAVETKFVDLDLQTQTRLKTAVDFALSSKARYDLLFAQDKYSLLPSRASVQRFIDDVKAPNVVKLRVARDYWRGIPVWDVRIWRFVENKVIPCIEDVADDDNVRYLVDLLLEKEAPFAQRDFTVKVLRNLCTRDDIEPNVKHLSFILAFTSGMKVVRPTHPDYENTLNTFAMLLLCVYQVYMYVHDIPALGLPPLPPMEGAAMLWHRAFTKSFDNEGSANTRGLVSTYVNSIVRSIFLLPFFKRNWRPDNATSCIFVYALWPFKHLITLSDPVIETVFGGTRDDALREIRLLDNWVL